MKQVQEDGKGILGVVNQKLLPVKASGRVRIKPRDQPGAWQSVLWEER